MSDRPVHDVYLSLGSNVDRERNLPAAVALMAARVTLVACSHVYESAPVGTLDQPSFFNAAAHIHTPLPPARLKREVLAAIEAALGRQRTADKNAPRTIDLDIVLYDDAVITYDGRDIPDPDLLRFAHIAVPVAELAPTLPHPETGEPLAAIALRLLTTPTPGYDGVVPLLRRPDVTLGP